MGILDGPEAIAPIRIVLKPDILNLELRLARIALNQPAQQLSPDSLVNRTRIDNSRQNY